MQLTPTVTPDSASSPDAESGPSAADQYSQGLAIALRKLNAHARTRHEISKVLIDKGIDEGLSGSIIDRLTELGYLNDIEFANEWVRSRVRSRGLALSVLRRELNSKGVDAEIIENALLTIDPADSDRRARELAEKKYRTLSGATDAVAMRRISALLQRKGYSAGQSWSISRSVVGGSDDFDAPSFQ